MLKSQLHPSPLAPSPILLHSSVTSHYWTPASISQLSPLIFRNRRPKSGSIRCEAVSNAPLDGTTTARTTVSVNAVVTIKKTIGGSLTDVGWDRGLDDISDLLGKSLLLELVSSELDPKTELEKNTIKVEAHTSKLSNSNDGVKYEADFEVEKNFGEVGGIFVTNEYHREMYLKDIVLSGFPNGPLHFTCKSWVHSKTTSPEKRVFFGNKSYLPSQTPSGLKRLREKELETLRGNGQGERKTFERIYDYDKYNDLGNPDKSDELLRSVLGGKDHPYPRRCRTGRPRSEKDPLSEKSGSTYVPRDEAFSEVTKLTFSAKTLKSVLHALVSSIETALVDTKLGFPLFKNIDSLFNAGGTLPPPKKDGIFWQLLAKFVKAIKDGQDNLLLFETPKMIERDIFSWIRDEEFARQTLAGINPMAIQLVTEFPLSSKLDPEIYGPPESAITKEIIEREIKSVMTVEEAIKQKKLFILDYHDLFLPYVNKVRKLEDTTLYGSRTLFFLSHEDTLMPIVIELTRPSSPTQPQWKRVFTPGWDATNSWLWKLAKAHVSAHCSGHHQLISHWLRTHCCTEPYVIATNRQLSVMHPIYRLLHPHLRYTMEINALARGYLINANGIIEFSFSPSKYSMEISSDAYHQLWRFDTEALPADLIKRGMAVEDPTAAEGLKLTIEDYPYAKDGLLIWSALKQWITDYVTHYYPDPKGVSSDSELQSWWTEIQTKGHEDKKDEPWWPVLKTTDDLIQILTTIIWVASGHHAAVNFGQYQFAGYFPNRPTIARKNIPIEDESSQEYARFLDRPESTLLELLPSQIQATTVMRTLAVLSNHNPEEEYLGDVPERAWVEEPIINAAFEQFSERIKEIEGIIDGRNADPTLKNRSGAGIVPYEFLKPFSVPGVTGMGVPNSISI
ncbi:linoleate 13S-lipoxygenase 2-1, chloroplastic-like isoform X2 [Tasmannia lanceolata]|uniref:linoleate 13S-lipoxygenase 2-1, chloroplastic-like isoform X2 n=1 Tax=Tasmannia lanceolata TaxID=3420 RepID=UPI0040641069